MKFICTDISPVDFFLVFSSRSQFSLSFKTSGQNGLLFYVADTRHIDFLGLYMVDGELHFGFNCGSGAAKIMSGITYNDGKWHEVRAIILSIATF